MTTPADSRAELSAALSALSDLLPQLLDALIPSGGPGRPSGNRHKSPVSLDVLVLITDIDNHVGYGSDENRVTRVLIWGEKTGDCVHSAELAMSWLARCRQILTPEQATIEPRPISCPHCHQRVVMVWNEDYREKVQKSALYFDIPRNTAFCRCCGRSWTQQNWSLLAKMLDAQRSQNPVLQSRSHG